MNDDTGRMTADSALHADALRILRGLAAQLARIHRPKEYARWREGAVRSADEDLAGATPFSDFADCWIFTGDGGYGAATGRFGNWAIDRLVEKIPPEEMIRQFQAEARRNSAVYREICPIFGVQIADPYALADGVELVPSAREFFSNPPQLWHYSSPPLPLGTCALVQAFTVSPAFERRAPEAKAPTASSATNPDRDSREAVRQSVRLACLLASGGAVELPLSMFEPDRKNLLAAGEGGQAQRPLHSLPVATLPTDPARIKEHYGQLVSFRNVDSLARAIDRLGRSRLAKNPVDQALDLGMAAEIALMHGRGSSNAGIAFKIGTRAAWLLGSDSADRAIIFSDIRKLYDARSKAVHSGVLTSMSHVELYLADALVTRILRGIVERGAFPDWDLLVLGGGPVAEGKAGR